MIMKNREAISFRGKLFVCAVSRELGLKDTRIRQFLRRYEARRWERIVCRQ